MGTIDRRQFLKQSSLFTLSTVLLPLSCGSINQPIRFGLATDSHYADREPAGTRFYRQVLSKMEEFVEVMNTEKVDFVVHLGDFKDEDLEKREEDTLQYLQSLEGVYGQFQGPRYHCVGNHDVDSITKTQFLTNIENTGIPKDKSYYSFDKKGFHFIVLDPNFHEDGADHFYKEGVDWEDTNLTDQQLDWLTKDLEATDKPTIVFCHQTLFEFFKEGSKFHVNDYLKAQKIMEASGKVLAVFQGHVHDERYTQINNIHYITHWGMVDYEGLDNNSFAIIEIEKEQIKVIGFKRVSDQSLTI